MMDLFRDFLTFCQQSSGFGISLWMCANVNTSDCEAETLTNQWGCELVLRSMVFL